MKNIKLNNKISIDLTNLLETRLLVQANSGGGKSWLLRRILEKSHGKVQQIVIDLEGEFSSLREKYDYVLASKEGDTPAEPRSAALLARKILELNVSTIIDLYELPHQGRKRFVKLFLDSMVNAPKNLWHPVLVVLDEAHIFCPEKGQAESAESVIDIATRGRKRGYCIVLATQRLSKLHKDAAAECNNKLIGRTGLDIDRKRASEELGFTKKEQSLSLRSLEAGEFFAFGPSISTEIIKVKVGGVETTHPKAGSRFKIKITPPTDRIKKIIKKFVDLPEEAKKEAQTVAELKQEIFTLKRDLRSAGQKKIVSPDITEKIIKTAIAKRDKEWLVKIGKERQLWKNQVDRFYEVVRKLGNTIAVIGQPDYPNPHCPNYIIPDGKDAGKISAFGIPKLKRQVIKVEKPKVADYPGNRIESEVEENDKPLTGGALRMLKVLVSRFPMRLTRTQLATFSKLSPRSGTYSTYLSALRSRGFFVEESGFFSASQTAIDELGETPNPPQTSEEVIAMWRDILKGGARRMFNVLIDEYPREFSKEELGEMAGLEYSSGTFGTYLSMLRGNSLIETKGLLIKASENLFL